MTPADAFWSRIERSEDGCWLWRGSVGSSGYGVTRLFGKSEAAHRVAYRLVFGSTPALLRHTCDVRLCVNPAHLVGGTCADNARDMVERGRSLSGERNRSARLQTADVERIRELRSEGWLQADLAALFGVTASMVSRIVNRNRWRNSDAA